jgi:hypothetical protein
MDSQTNSQPEQSGKQLALGIFAFIVGTIALLLLLHWLLF